MKYSQFNIYAYKGIKSLVAIDLSTNSLIPIIGVNECGKTTILEALLCFDSHNDNNYNQRHIEHIQNLYSNKSEKIVISAVIEYKTKELASQILSFLDKEMDFEEAEIEEDQKLEKFELRDYVNSKLQELKSKSSIEIYRTLNTKEYSFNKDATPSKEEDILCSEIVRLCPFMLYFDDFQDDFNGIVKYRNDESNEEEEQDDVTKNLWYKTVNKLFEEADSEFSLSKLISSGDLTRNIISDVKNHLNGIINKSWINFSLEKGEPPIIDIVPLSNYRLRFEIIEKIKAEDGTVKERHFGIKERSKGFYWFFNFIMKLHFNPQKRYRKDTDTIYLLDEPGSYLHSTAQKNLLDQLQTISRTSKVVYTTHSPFLLDPKKIPLKNIKISSKSDLKGIQLDNFSTAPKKLGGKNSPFQILMHYLEITPMSMNFSKDRLVIVEGIFDYYWFEMLKGNRNLNFFPSSNADSTLFHISYMIADGKSYSVIWDNDIPGKRAFNKAKNVYGESESERWSLLKLKGKSKVVVEDLISTKDKEMISEELGKSSSSKKMVTLLYYSKKRKSILGKISEETKNNFNEMYNLIELKMKC